MAGARLVIANRKGLLDSVFKRRVDIACADQGWDVDVAGGDRGPDPGESAIGRVIHEHVDAAAALAADVVDHRRVHHAGWIYVRQEIRIVVRRTLPGQFDGRRPVGVGSILQGHRRLHVRLAAVAVEIDVHHVDAVVVGVG